MDLAELQRAYEQVAGLLRARATPEGPWVGELSASALSTATAITALTTVSRALPDVAASVCGLIDRGVQWMLTYQRDDGGWGDTTQSFSNISTTMLCRAALRMAGAESAHPETVQRAEAYLNQHGGVAAIHARYGKDRTFSAPILTQCAIAGLVDWKEVAALPFELACLPHSFYKSVSLRVVSYALPALIAIGQVRHHFLPTWNPLLRGLRHLAKQPTLRLLEQIQPASGGYLEAIPLTSFVTMSLAAMGAADHPVARRGVDFLINSVRADGSWAIDVNLATWLTTLSVNALSAESLPEPQAQRITDWLLNQQLKTEHPYTHAAPGGWAWTDLSGGVPDADDTPGAVLAVLKLARAAADGQATTDRSQECVVAAARGIDWLLGLQNRDGGWPTFCRGWGALPFDRSACDITAHVLLAIQTYRTLRDPLPAGLPLSPHDARLVTAVNRGREYLRRQQRADGSWLPLWFGNQAVHDDENPLYGTSRVLISLGEQMHLDPTAASACRPLWSRGLQWLCDQQNPDGGWGGSRGVSSSVEETSLAIHALACGGFPGDDPRSEAALERGFRWIQQRIAEGTIDQATPIGLYFAKLWYFEALYPLVFCTAALRRTIEKRPPAPS